MEDDEYLIDLTNMDGTTISVTVPSNPNIGDLWIDTTSMTTNVYTLNNNWITVSDTFDISDISLSKPVEFEDCMPSVAKVEDMCRDYPALEKAYENFKTVYKLVHQDWQGRQDDEPPF